MDGPGRSIEPIDKPVELVALSFACKELFDRLRRWFEVGPQLKADLSSIDSPEVVTELRHPPLIAAFAMRRLQALHHLAQPGVQTTVDVVVHHIDGVLRALVEAPGLHLSKVGDGVDWDRAWETLDAGMLILNEGCPQADAEAYRDNIRRLIAARTAVIQLARSAGATTIVLT